MLPCYVIGESGTLGRLTMIILKMQFAGFQIDRDMLFEYTHVPCADFTICGVRPFATNFHQASQMLEILVVMAIAVIFAAKRPRRRRWTGNDRMVPWTTNTALLALLDAIVVKGTTVGTSDRSFRLLSYNTMWGLRGQTPGEGPIVVGYAHDDYSVTEIKEALEAEATMTTANKVAGEQANRLVRKVGTFPGADEDEVLNDGKPIRTRLNWAIPLGSNISVFAWNRSGATLTTGAVLSCQGDARVRFT